MVPFRTSLLQINLCRSNRNISQVSLYLLITISNFSPENYQTLAFYGAIFSNYISLLFSYETQCRSRRLEIRDVPIGREESRRQGWQLSQPVPISSRYRVGKIGSPPEMPCTNTWVHRGGKYVHTKSAAFLVKFQQRYAGETWSRSPFTVLLTSRG